MDFLSTSDNGLHLQIDNRKKTIKFETGDPIVDWYSYMKYIANSEDVDTVCNSSTIDHWFDDDEHFFIYFDSNLEPVPYEKWDTLSTGEVMNLIRFAAKEPMKTFTDIKEYCRGKVK